VKGKIRLTRGRNSYCLLGKQSSVSAMGRTCNTNEKR